MTFQRIRRGLVDQRKPEPVGRDEIVLMWTDNPPSPCLSIYIGYDLSQAIGLKTSTERVQLFVGKGEDQGRVGICKAVDYSDGDFRCVSHSHLAHRVYLTSQISVTHFAICPRTRIPRSKITLRGNMVVFEHAGVSL